MHPMTDQLQPPLRGYLRGGSDEIGDRLGAAAEGEGSVAAGIIGQDGIADPSHHRRRRLEDANVDYWRQRAGWADDDETMKDYNQGVYETYYMGDDVSGGSDGSYSPSSKSSGSGTAKAGIDHLGWILGLASTLIFLIMLAKCCSSAPASGGRKGRTSSVKSRDSSRSIRDKHGERRSRSRSRAASGRSRSKSRARSKSKSRRAGDDDGGGEDAGGADYKLMDDDDAKSRRSTKSSSSKRSSRSRSRSKSARSRSKSKGRSKSRSRASGSSKDREDGKGEKKKERSKEQKMLV